jgi:hypothetical protein
MDQYLLIAICAGSVWLLHAYFRLTGRKESGYTAWLLLAGLPVLAIVLFVSAALAEEPDPSRFAVGHVGDGGLGEMVLSIQTILVWFVVGFAEFILAIFAPKRRNLAGDEASHRG